MDAADKYISILQVRFPNVTVKWNPPPHPIFELTSCTLEFSSKVNPEVIYPLEFPNGLGNNKIEDDIAVLVSLHGEQLDSL